MIIGNMDILYVDKLAVSDAKACLSDEKKIYSAIHVTDLAE